MRKGNSLPQFNNPLIKKEKMEKENEVKTYVEEFSESYKQVY